MFLQYDLGIISGRLSRITYRKAQLADFRRFGFRKLASNIAPARLTEIGRDHLERAVRTEDILSAWMLDGFLLVFLPLLARLPWIARHLWSWRIEAETELPALSLSPVIFLAAPQCRARYAPRSSSHRLTRQPPARAART